MIEPLHPFLNILLADDDKDDRFFFDLVLKKLHLPIELATVEDGAMLIKYLDNNSAQLPDALFLDLNMPRKNGMECLEEIKNNEKLKGIPVIIYSTSLNEDVVDQLYKNGAHCYVRKSDLSEIEKIFLYIFSLIFNKEFERPPRNEFIINVKNLISLSDS